MDPTPFSIFAKAGLPEARRHLFLCAGPDCCPEAEGHVMWEHLKEAVRTHASPVMRTRAACFRICQQGPWLVIYPDGVWYSHVTPERFDRIRREHLEGGVPVAEWVRAINHLPANVRPPAG